jgi:hypothetical protein
MEHIGCKFIPVFNKVKRRALQIFSTIITIVGDQSQIWLVQSKIGGQQLRV